MHQRPFLKYLHFSLGSHVPEDLAYRWHETSPVESTASVELGGRQGSGDLGWTDGLGILSGGQQAIEVGPEDGLMIEFCHGHRDATRSAETYSTTATDLCGWGRYPSLLYPILLVKKFGSYQLPTTDYQVPGRADAKGK